MPLYDIPPERYDDAIVVSVLVKSPPERLYSLVTDVEGLSSFFPWIEIGSAMGSPLELGDTYYARLKRTRKRVPYRVVALEPGARMVGELAGEDPLFEALRYEHRFVAEDDYTTSHERVDYRLRYGAVGRVVNLLFVKRLMRKQILGAHLRLKEKAESHE